MSPNSNHGAAAENIDDDRDDDLEDVDGDRDDVREDVDGDRDEVREDVMVIVMMTMKVVLV